MKYIVFLLTCSVGLLAGCVEKHDSSLPTREPEGVTELQIPAGFDWAAARDVRCDVVSAVPAKIFVSTSADSEPFAVFHAGAGVAPVTFSIPAQVETLYVSSRTSQGVSSPRPVPVTNGVLSFDPSDGRYVDIPSEEDKENALIYVPARKNGWGTILFEDLWPSYGDYDFNDLAINYRMRHSLAADNRVSSTQIVLRVAALGGSKPFELFLQMHGVKNSDIASVSELYPAKNATGNAAVELYPPFDPIKNRAFFRFRDVRGNVNRPGGIPYFNTMPGGEVGEDGLVEVAVEIRYKEPVQLRNLEFAGIDFFVAEIDGAGSIVREIHCFGYEPVNGDLYVSLVNPDRNQEYYESKDGLVWAVNVPADIRHAYEKANFLNAYPRFKNWAQSGGRLDKDWYEYGVDSYLIAK